MRLSRLMSVPVIALLILFVLIIALIIAET
jgi:hypothetical protein